MTVRDVVFDIRDGFRSLTEETDKERAKREAAERSAARKQERERLRQREEQLDLEERQELAAGRLFERQRQAGRDDAVNTVDIMGVQGRETRATLGAAGQEQRNRINTESVARINEARAGTDEKLRILDPIMGQERWTADKMVGTGAALPQLIGAQSSREANYNQALLAGINRLTKPTNLGTALVNSLVQAAPGLLFAALGSRG